MILSAPDPALDRAFAAALLRLQHDAYRSQAELIGDDRFTALTADEISLPAWRGRYLVAWEGIQLLGAVAWHPDGVVDIDRVMVDAPARRCGVATTLVRAVLERIGAATVETVTGRDNVPGLALYRRLGFEPVGEERAPTGMSVIRLRRG